jgi:hypothetical protein
MRWAKKVPVTLFKREFTTNLTNHHEHKGKSYIAGKKFVPLVWLVVKLLNFLIVFRD